ncbi:MAG: chemotaxis protein CheB [Bacteroidetes bacterium]|nr:chemotaxis protein CheB [Bacteroidota bacterium]
MAEDSINKYQLIVIGGSAGSLDVLLHVIPKLKADFHIPIVLVLHRMNSYDSTLTELIATKTVLKVKEVEDKEPQKEGYIYIAPADYHLLIEKDRMFSLDFSEKVNFSRPSIDITFASAADAFGEKAVCILLSGANADGVDGMQAIKNAGGLVVVQDPKTAEVSFMPAQAILNVEVDKILKIDEMAGFINSLA